MKIFTTRLRNILHNMLKYLPEESKVVFREIPDEVTLAINITGCPIHCPCCHSKHLWEDIGNELDIYALDELIKKNSGITCVCFMGGDRREWELENLCKHIKRTYGLKTAWYSGQDECPSLEFMESLDYLKLGPYIEEKGPLNHPGTNQKLFRLEHCFTANFPILATDGTQILGKYVMMHDITDKVK